MKIPGGLGRQAALVAVAVIAMAATSGSASATLPGKNGSLLISTMIKEGSPNYSTYLYTETLAGKSKRLLGNVEYSFRDGAVSPNGKQIAFTRYPGYQLWLGPLANPGKAKAITALDPELNNDDPVFSPDGKSIYYSSTYFTEAGVGWHLRRYDLKTKKIKNYKVNQQLDGGLSDVSPNGRLLAYNRGGDDHETVIRFLDTKTGKSRNFKFGYPTGDAHFSPDGKSIAFIAYVKDSPEVFTAKLNGKGAKRLTRGGINYYPTYSPDGRQVAFTQGPDAVKRIGVTTLKTGKTRYLKAPGDYTEIDQWLRK